MKTILKFGIAFCLAGTVSYARDWNGKLIDAGCYDKNPSTVQAARHRASVDLGKTCVPNSSTTAFAFQSADSGKVYKLDENSNAKVEKGIADGVLKPSKSDGEYRVFVMGSHKTGVMVVNGIQPRKYRNSAEY
jgi:hypothetical protein